MLEIGDVKIDRIAHAAFRMEAPGQVLYIDPFRLPENLPEGSIVLITHDHFDHCSVEDLRKIVGPMTRIVLPPDCQSKILAGRIGCRELLLVKPGIRLAIGDVKIEAVHAYNIGKRFHPRDNEWVGYVIEIGGVRVYHAGDTDTIPEMKNLEGIDVALVPVGGTYTMNGREAARAAALFGPKIAVPMHYGSIVGSRADAEEFKANWTGKTVILE